MTPAERASVGYCRRTARRANSSFPLAFRLLPPAERDAMTALYAFYRLTDDLADGPGPPDAKRLALAAWRDRLHAALAGKPTHPVHPAVAAAARRFAIPAEHLQAPIAGAERDLASPTFATFAELEGYCHQVASAVGLACVRVWGLNRPDGWADADGPATAAGVAFQLTNVLRDVGEDLARGRVYLPQEDLARFGCPPECWADPASRGRFRAMLRFQADRAEAYYRRAEPLADLLTRDGRAVFAVMAGLYRRLLGEIVRRDFPVLDARVRVPKAVKLRVFAGGWVVKWGWA